MNWDACERGGTTADTVLPSDAGTTSDTIVLDQTQDLCQNLSRNPDQARTGYNLLVLLRAVSLLPRRSQS